MPAVPVSWPSPLRKCVGGAVNPLPQFLQTPSGLAVVEIQGTIHAPHVLATSGGSEEGEDSTNAESVIGRLEFPEHPPPAAAQVRTTDPDSMPKRVHLYVGSHQRLVGEIRKLDMPLAMLRKRPSPSSSDELEIVEVATFKILFSSRPEPVTDS